MSRTKYLINVLPLTSVNEPRIMSVLSVYPIIITTEHGPGRSQHSPGASSALLWRRREGLANIFSFICPIPVSALLLALTLKYFFETVPKLTNYQIKKNSLGVVQLFSHTLANISWKQSFAKEGSRSVELILHLKPDQLVSNCQNYSPKTNKVGTSWLQNCL